MKTLLFVLVLAVLETASAQPIIKGSFAEPVGAELDKFPIKTGRLSAKEQAELGLSVKKLDKPTVVQNHFRNIRPTDNGRFVLENLPVGTPVLVDKVGKLRYKADCGNRIVEVASCSQCPTISGGVGSKPKDTLKEGDKGTGGGKGFFQSILDETKAGAAWVWNILWNLLQWLFWALAYVIASGLIAAIPVGLYFLVRDTINRWRRSQPRPPQPSTQSASLTDIPAATQPAAAPVGMETQRASVAPEWKATEPVPTVKPTASAPNSPQPATTAPRSFPENGILFERANLAGPARFQIGKTVGRVEATTNPQDGSVTIRIF